MLSPRRKQATPPPPGGQSHDGTQAVPGISGRRPGARQGPRARGRPGGDRLQEPRPQPQRLAGHRRGPVDHRWGRRPRLPGQLQGRKGAARLRYRIPPPQWDHFRRDGDLGGVDLQPGDHPRRRLQRQDHCQVFHAGRGRDLQDALGSPRPPKSAGPAAERTPRPAPQPALTVWSGERASCGPRCRRRA